MKNSIHKDRLDIINSFSWFFMDAAWMCGYTNVAFVVAPFVVISGILLCFSDRRTSNVSINLAVLFWILMNLTWMTAEVYNHSDYLTAAKIFFALGMVAIGVAATTSENLRDTFARFKRPRFGKLQDK